MRGTLGWVGLLAGCGSFVAEEDTGDICVLWEADDEPLVITVNYGCAPCKVEDVQVSCEASFDGVDTITVSSSVSYRDQWTMNCESICRVMLATCEVDPLPAGDYVLVHGDATTSVTLGEVDPTGEGICP